MFLAGRDSVFAPLILPTPPSAQLHAQCTVEANAHPRINFPGLTCWTERNFRIDLAVRLPQLGLLATGHEPTCTVGISTGDKVPDS